MICLIRSTVKTKGGAERYFERLAKELGPKSPIKRPFTPKWVPSWLRALWINFSLCRQKEPNIRYFSLDRITCADIYRAGDGVHKAFLRTKGFSLNPLHLVYLWLEKRTFENAQIIIANSLMVKDQIIEHYGIDANKIEVIYNGVPIPETFNKASAKESLAKTFKFDPKTPIILFVGSGFRRKGVEAFLTILSHLTSPFHAFVVGKEKKLSHYIALAKKLKIKNRVTFTGPREDVETFYEGSDIFLFPTHYEPFSNVVLEAMSYGCAVFTTRQNGASEVINPSFILEHPYDLTVVEKIEKLLKNPQRRMKAQDEARRIVQNFSIEKNVEQTLAIIEKVKGPLCYNHAHETKR